MKQGLPFTIDNGGFAPLEVRVGEYVWLTQRTEEMEIALVLEHPVALFLAGYLTAALQRPAS